MNLKDLVRKEVAKKPPRIVLHGVHGVGKSSWAAGAPNPIFIPTEDGLTTIEVDHFPVATSWAEVAEYMGLLMQEENQFKTVVIDTVDWLEKMIWAQVCSDHGCKSMEDLGYGKGYIFAMQYWDKFFAGLDKLREQGMAVVVLAHNEIKAYNPPDSEPYDRYQIKLHRHAATKLEEWADIVMFANFVVYVNKTKQQEKSEKAGKALNTAERVIHTTNSPAWRAKTRYRLPDTLPMDFTALLTAIKGDNNG